MWSIVFEWLQWKSWSQHEMAFTTHLLLQFMCSMWNMKFNTKKCWVRFDLSIRNWLDHEKCLFHTRMRSSWVWSGLWRTTPLLKHLGNPFLKRFSLDMWKLKIKFTLENIIMHPNSNTSIKCIVIYCYCHKLYYINQEAFTKAPLLTTVA